MPSRNARPVSSSNQFPCQQLNESESIGMESHAEERFSRTSSRSLSMLSAINRTTFRYEIFIHKAAALPSGNSPYRSALFISHFPNISSTASTKASLESPRLLAIKKYIAINNPVSSYLSRQSTASLTYILSLTFSTLCQFHDIPPIKL